MNFRDEYKFAAEELTPDKATVERIKAGVHRRINGEHRPFYLKRAAYIGGAIAACAVVTFTAVKVLPMLNSRVETGAPNTIVENYTKDECLTDAAGNGFAPEFSEENIPGESISDNENNFNYEVNVPEFSDNISDASSNSEIAPQLPNIQTDNTTSSNEIDYPSTEKDSSVPENITVDEPESVDSVEDEEPSEDYDPFSDVGPFTEDDYYPNGFRFFESGKKISVRTEDRISVLRLQSDSAVPDDIEEWLALPIVERSSEKTYLFYYHASINGLIWVKDAQTNKFVGLYIHEE